VNETGSRGTDFTKILTLKVSPTWSLRLVSILRCHELQVGHSPAAKPVFAAVSHWIVWWGILRLWCVCVCVCVCLVGGGVISLNISIVSFQTSIIAFPCYDNCRISVKKDICVEWLKQP
jgi:hypothetical protein